MRPVWERIRRGLGETAQEEERHGGDDIGWRGELKEHQTRTKSFSEAQGGEAGAALRYNEKATELRQQWCLWSFF